MGKLGGWGRDDGIADQWERRQTGERGHRPPGQKDPASGDRLGVECEPGPPLSGC